MSAVERGILLASQECALGVSQPSGLLWYRSRVLAREGDLVWVECAPAAARELARARAPEVLVDTWHAADALYRVRARVASVEPAYTRLALRVLDVARIQRRAYFRVPLMRKAEDASLVDAGGATWSLKLLVRDLSAEGIGALTAMALRDDYERAPVVGDEIQFTLRLPGRPEPIHLRARLVRVSGALRSTAAIYEVGADFVALAPPTREELIHYALTVQYEYARRGLL